LKVNRRFGETYHLQLQGRKISRARNKRESRGQAEKIILIKFTFSIGLFVIIPSLNRKQIRQKNAKDPRVLSI
jgi:hypothetical protein